MHVPAGFLVRHCTTVYVTEISMIFFTFFMRKAKISTYLFLWKIKTSKGLLRKAKKNKYKVFLDNEGETSKVGENVVTWDGLLSGRYGKMMAHLSACHTWA